MIESVVWSPKSKRDLKQIKTFFDKRNGNSEYSRRLLKIFKDSGKVIQEQPLIGRSTDIRDVRAFIILNYFIFYEILDKTISILTVWDCRRDPKQLPEF